jgi:hypothetical protein
MTDGQAVALRLEFLSGRYHARPWGSAPEEERTEWPPSPWRVARALVDVAYRHGLLGGLSGLISALAARPWRFTLPDARELTVASYQLPTPKKLSAKDVPVRFVQREAAKRLGHTGARAQLVRDTQVILGADRTVWAHLPALVDAERELLAALIARLGWLGRAETWVSADLDPAPPEPNSHPVGDGEAEVPHADVRTLLCLASDVGLDQLTVTTLRSRRHGPVPAGAVPLAYTVPLVRRASRPRAPSPRSSGAVWLRLLGRGVAAARLVALTDAVRGASRSGGKAAPPMRVAVVPDRKRPGTLRDVHVLLGDGQGSSGAAALSRLTDLSVRGLDEPVGVRCLAVGDQALGALPGPAAEWASVTPVLVDLAFDIEAAVSAAGGQPPAAVERISEHERARERQPHWSGFAGLDVLRRSAVAGWRVRFAQPVRGPLLVGPGQERGFGLFLPVVGA